MIKELWTYGQNVLQQVLNNPRMNIIVGSIGMGKTAHTFLLAELKHKHTPKNPVYIHVFDEARREKLSSLLPNWIHLSTDKNMTGGRIDYRSFPRGSIIIVEELAGVDNSKNLPKNEVIIVEDIQTHTNNDQDEKSDVNTYSNHSANTIDEWKELSEDDIWK